MPATRSCHVPSLAFLSTGIAAITMINRATTPAPANKTIGPQLRPWLTLTGVTGRRPLPPLPAVCGRAGVRPPLADGGRSSSFPALPERAAAGFFAPDFWSSVAVAFVAFVENGLRRESPVLMLMGPR